MSRDSLTINEGDRLWPVVQIIRATHYDDLTRDRIQQLVDLVDSWRITDPSGKPIQR